MRICLFLIPIFFFLGCNKTSQVTLISIPEGARIYDSNSNKLLAKTPAKLTYVFDNDPLTPECELVPPITAIWNDNEAVVTERNIILCPNRDYKLLINQNTYKRARDYDLLRHDSAWSITPYFGFNTSTNNIDIDILPTNTSVSDKSNSSLYKLGFKDEKNNRIELNYSTLNFQEEDLNLYSIDTIITIDKLRKNIIEPNFKFGLGYSDYSYDNGEFVNPMYTLGFGFYAYMNKDIELDFGLSRVSHINYSSIAKELGFHSSNKRYTKIEINNVLIGLNYKF